MNGEKEFRFISFNIPNLHYIEDDMAFEKVLPYRFPDEFEIADALLSVRQMGGQVARMYALTVRKETDPSDMPRHVLGPGEFDEEGFRALDKILQMANEIGVRVIIPFVDNWWWLGGVNEYAAFRGKGREAFWTDPELLDDMKETIEFVINRKNTYTGVYYRDDKAILAWETGNEIRGPRSWGYEMTKYIKSLDKNHLVLDGYDGRFLTEDSFEDPNNDIVHTHHYEKNPRDMVEHIRASAKLARGKRPYILGEFGFISTAGVKAVMDALIEEGVSGGMTWSLRFHSRDGGFYWHHEPAGGDQFKAFHWPGFQSGMAYNERELLMLLRDKAYEIRGLEVPTLPSPKAPTLLPIKDPAAICWQGSVGASSYTVERATSQTGPWRIVGQEISDARYMYRPQFNDESIARGQSYYYRVRARNSSGISAPSNIVGPVISDHLTLVDEMEHNQYFFFAKGALSFRTNQARKFKEDSHRLTGEKGSYVIYYVPEPIKSWKVYCFSAQDTMHFNFSISADGREFTDLEPQHKNYFSGGGDYGYLQPVLYYKEGLVTEAKYLKIEFVEEVQISRVVIGY